MATAELAEPKVNRVGLATVPEVAEFLSVSRAKLYLMMDAGHLAYVKLGKSRRVRWSDVDHLVTENTVGK
jgi:excisionase family DNA binding protein